MEETEIFIRKRVVVKQLIPYGFIKSVQGFYFRKDLLNGQFYLMVEISKDGRVNTQVIDASSNEEYVLHRVPGTVGSFTASVREAYENVMLDIATQCFESDIFKSEQARKLIVYARKTYGDELEYLWQQLPDNAVWRRKDNNKWYGAMLTVARHKLGIQSDERVEIIDLREAPEKLSPLIDHKKYFPGWHMNKKNWYTILLDGSVPTKELCHRLAKSYLLSGK